MTDINISFCRSLLSSVLTEVDAHMRLGTLDCGTAREDAKKAIKSAWVYKVGKDHWEFHFGDYYWHGSADNAYDARAKGWSAWLAKNGAAGYVAEVV